MRRQGDRRLLTSCTFGSVSSPMDGTTDRCASTARPCDEELARRERGHRANDAMKLGVAAESAFLRDIGQVAFTRAQRVQNRVQPDAGSVLGIDMPRARRNRCASSDGLVLVASLSSRRPSSLLARSRSAARCTQGCQPAGISLGPQPPATTSASANCAPRGSSPPWNAEQRASILCPLRRQESHRRPHLRNSGQRIQGAFAPDPVDQRRPERDHPHRVVVGCLVEDVVNTGQEPDDVAGRYPLLVGTDPDDAAAGSDHVELELGVMMARTPELRAMGPSARGGAREVGRLKECLVARHWRNVTHSWLPPSAVGGQGDEGWREYWNPAGADRMHYAGMGFSQG